MSLAAFLLIFATSVSAPALSRTHATAAGFVPNAFGCNGCINLGSIGMGDPQVCYRYARSRGFGNSCIDGLLCYGC